MLLNELSRAALHRRSLLAYILLVLLLPALASLCSCASGQGTPPPGGPKDTTAPAVLATDPPSGTTNFNESSVSIRFSEILPESGVPEAVTITPIPAIPPKYDWNWSGNTLDITFSEPLLANRTYTITLGASVADLAGNRLGHPYTLRFATGDKIDSGRIQGEVIGKAAGKAFVFAYQLPAGATELPGFHPDSIRPDFIAPIGDDGTFSLEGLPAGTFRLLAVVDEFGDQLYSPGQDAYGVPVGDVRLDSATVPITGVSFRLRSGPDDLTSPALYSATSLALTRTSLRFNEPVDSASLRPANFDVSAGTTAATVRNVWRSPSNALAVELSHDALPAGAEATVAVRDIHDTIAHPIADSVSRTTFTVSDAPDTLPPSLLPLAVDSLHPYSFTDSLRFVFDEAVHVASLEGAVSISDTAGPHAPFRVTQLSPTEFVARPIDTLFGLASGVIEINLGRFTDDAGNRRDSVTSIVVPIAPPRQSGTLQGTITDSAAPNAAHVVVIRATAGGTTYRKVIRSGAWEFNALPEGEYEISAFRDSDGNGIYDYGSIAPFRFAEAYVVWHGTVRVRPRWVTNKIDLVLQ